MPLAAIADAFPRGDADTVVPVGHVVWLAGRIPGATLVRESAAGHAGHFAATPATLRWLLGDM